MKRQGSAGSKTITSVTNRTATIFGLAYVVTRAPKSGEDSPTGILISEEAYSLIRAMWAVGSGAESLLLLLLSPCILFIKQLEPAFCVKGEG